MAPRAEGSGRAVSPTSAWAAPQQGWGWRKMAEGNQPSLGCRIWDRGCQICPATSLRVWAPRTRQVTQKSISRGDVGAGTNSPPDYLPTLPLIT